MHNFWETSLFTVFKLALLEQKKPPRLLYFKLSVLPHHVFCFLSFIEVSVPRKADIIYMPQHTQETIPSLYGPSALGKQLCLCYFIFSLSSCVAAIFFLSYASELAWIYFSFVPLPRLFAGDINKTGCLSLSLGDFAVI